MIVAVLMLLVALGALAAGMFLETGLATLGARSASQAAVARPLARAGLIVALDELRAAQTIESSLLELGPWERLGEGVTGRLTVEEGSDPVAYRAAAEAVVGKAVARAEAVFVTEPAFEIIEWRD